MKKRRLKIMDKLIVTRHTALVAYLIEKGYVDKDTPHIAHADVEDVKGKHVYGILPNWLACHADKFTEVQLRLPVDKRGAELSLKDVKFYIVEPKTYTIRRVI
jgi:hypothetical protein